MADGENFLKRIRGNAEWEVIKLIGGSGVMTSVLNVCAANMRHVRPDWLMWECVFGGGVIIACFGYWRESKTKTENIVAPKVDDLTSGVTVPFVDLHAVARNQDLADMGSVWESLFTPLQREAIQLSEDLRQFMLRIGKQPNAPPGSDFDAIFESASSGEGWKWVVKMQAEYESDYSPRINTFISKLERETGHLNIRLRNYKDHVHDFANINTVRAQLWKEALYPLDVSFDGE